jgi:ABC-type transport system involved in multi-copper enzyme maturation permease subunit
MTHAIFYKEWLKTRRAFWVCMLLSAIMAVYAIMCIRRVGASHGVEHIWLIMLMKDQTFIDSIKFFPPLVGLALGVAQMSPEMQQKRLKLTLHLPYPQGRLVTAMVGAGLLECLAVFLLQALVIGIYYSTVVTPEMTWHVMLTTFPWYLAGFNTYLFTAAVCLEGRWRRRIAVGLIGVGVVCVFYMQAVPQAYNGMLFGAVLFTLLLMLLSVNSVNRFKEGLID